MLFLTTGCINSESSSQIDYDEAIQSAYDFVKEKDWDNAIVGEMENATVEESKAEITAEYTDSSYEDQEVLLVTFEDDPNSTTGTPTILVNPKTLKVVGYILSE